MKLNKFIWNNYKETTNGKEVIQLFENGNTKDILNRFSEISHFDIEEAVDFIDILKDCLIEPILPDVLSFDEAEKLFDEIIEKGFTLKYEDENIDQVKYRIDDLLHLIANISTWLFYEYPDLFKPYFFKTRFQLLTQIADAFEIDLPEVPLKKYKEKRFKYYSELCEVFTDFQKENDMSPYEFCAFLYDFAPKVIEQNKIEDDNLPQPTQVWMIGGNKQGGDFDFLDNFNEHDTTFWQGNLDTKRGDIIIMYCLHPRSYIHSIWRATKDGIADPFFNFYSSIYIGHGVKVSPIYLNELKTDHYFSEHSMVRKNFQGMSDSSFSVEDYKKLQDLLIEKGYNTSNLPQIYSPQFSLNSSLKSEKEVENKLLEPFLREIGYQEKHWIRQLPVRMGRGERNFPDYVFLISGEKGYEIASMIIEVKFWIKNNKELEDAFKQVYSYGQRLSAKILIIADKDALWIYEKLNDNIDRTKYIKKYWKELENTTDFVAIKKLLGRK